MSAARLALRGAVMFLLAVLQVSVADRLDLPLGPPDLVALGVVCFALADGPAAGAGCGFLGGLLCDAMAIHPIGRLALLLSIVGYATGLVRFEASRSRLWALATVAGATVATTVGYALVAGIAGDAGVLAGETLRRTAGAAAWNLLLAPFVLPPAVAAARRVRPGRFA